MSQYKVIGTRPIRPDGADKVTGRAIYGADLQSNSKEWPTGDTPLAGPAAQFVSLNSVSGTTSTTLTDTLPQHLIDR